MNDRQRENTYAICNKGLITTTQFFKDPIYE